MSERREVRGWTVSEPPEVTLSGEVVQLRAAIESLFPAEEGYTEAFDELKAWRRSAAKNHPDAGGDSARFEVLARARDALGLS